MITVMDKMYPSLTAEMIKNQDGKAMVQALMTDHKFKHNSKSRDSKGKAKEAIEEVKFIMNQQHLIDGKSKATLPYPELAQRFKTDYIIVDMDTWGRKHHTVMELLAALLYSDDNYITLITEHVGGYIKDGDYMFNVYGNCIQPTVDGMSQVIRMLKSVRVVPNTVNSLR